MRFFYLLLLLANFSFKAQAQTLIALNHLDFGEVLDMGSSSRSRITLDGNGSYTADSAFIFIREPTPAHLQLTGAPPNSMYTIDFSSNAINITSGGSRFRINNYTTFPNILMTDGFGNSDFFVGARLNTRRGGSTSPYPDGIYTGTIDLTVVF